jgi:hypothetical protein
MDPIFCGVGYFCGLAVFYVALSTWLPATFPRVNSLDEKRQVGVTTRVMCSVHCLVSSIGSAWCLLQLNWIGPPAFFNGNPDVFVPGAAIFLAIELAELIFMTALDLRWGVEPANLLHHVCGFFTLTPCFYFNQGMNIMLWVHLVQFTQPFLYAGWIMYTLELTDTGIYRFLFPACSALCLLFWVVLRLVVCGFPILYSLWTTASKWQSSGHHTTLVLAQLIFIGLNFYWFYLLVKKAARTFAVRPAAKSNAKAS